VGAVTELHAARVPGSTAHYVGEGICSVCGLVVPLGKTAGGRAQHHYPDKPIHSYGENPNYFCTGSNAAPERVLAPPEMERASVFTCWWSDGIEGAEVRRLSREWARTISSKVHIEEVRVQTFGTVAA